MQKSILRRSNTFDWAAAHRVHGGWIVGCVSLFPGASAGQARYPHERATAQCSQGRAERPVSVRLREEVQEVLRRGDRELTCIPDSSNGSAPTSQCDNCCARGFCHEEQAGLQGLRYRGTIMRATRRRVLGRVAARAEFKVVSDDCSASRSSE
jgi:hypothetical protein